jgi:CRP-like cAMP-binding protein
VPYADRPSPKNRLLSGLSQRTLDEIYSHLSPVILSQRQVIYETGEPIEHVYFIEKGVISLLTDMADGAAIETAMIGIEGMTGVPALLGADGSSQQVIVQIPGEALRMTAALCKVAFEARADFRNKVLRFADVLMNVTAQTAACNRLHSLEQRCARWLLMACERGGSDTVPMTHEFLSTMLGVRRAGITTAAGELQRSGMIRYRRGEVTIVNRESLADSACECYRADHERFARLAPSHPGDRS